MTTKPITPATSSALSVGHLWQDTASERVKQELVLGRFPDGVRELQADVVVVGAGVSGLSAAGACARLGMKTILLERSENAAFGASGRNAGIVCMGANLLRSDLTTDEYDWLWIETTQLGLELYEASKQAESDPDVFVQACMVGSITLALDKEHAAGFDEEVRERAKLGLPAEIISLEEVSRMTDGRLSTKGVYGALLLPHEGRCHPWTLCAHLARRARKAGAIMYGGSTVSGIVPNAAPAGGWRVELSGGEVVRARAVIRCTGPTVEANKRIYAMAFELGVPETFPVFQDANSFTYYDYRSGDGHIVCTGGPYADANDIAVDTHHLSVMADTVRGWVPELAGKEPKYRWAVDLKVLPDMVPHLEQLSPAAPGYSINGLGALGVLPGILLGRKAATRLASEFRCNKK